MARLEKWLLAGLLLLPALGACREKPKSAAGAPCESAGECQSGLSCVEGACRPATPAQAAPAKAEPAEAEKKCRNAKACRMSDACVPWGDECGWEAKTPMDCVVKRGRLGISPCKNFGRCTVKDDRCVAGSDEDCAKSGRCKNGGACTAKDGMCQK